MFAIIDGILQALPDSLVRDGFVYTDLWSQSYDYLESLGIYKLPDMPPYNPDTQKLEVDLERKDWLVVDLTEQEIEDILNTKYETMYIRNYSKYTHYQCLLKNSSDEPQITLQLKAYILDLLNYCLAIKTKTIPLEEISDFPDPILEHFSNPVK